MVRKVIINVALALGVAFALLSPLPALADEVDSVEDVADSGADVAPLIENLADKLETHSSNTDTSLVQIVTELYVIESYLRDLQPVTQPETTLETVSEPEKGPTEIELLTHIDETLSELAEEPEQVTREGVEPIRAARLSISAYGNVSPRNQYAVYAEGYLPRVGFNENYVYVQDTQQSYTFVWGDLEKVDSTTISGTSCDYVRWYFASQSQGYLMESGTADVNISTGSHVVISSLDGFPLLDPQQDTLRKEVGFYAQVATVLFSLASVWSFLTRLRGAVSV